MAKKSFEIAFQLGAEMDPSVKKAFGNAQKQMGKMRKSVTNTIKTGAKLAAGFTAAGAVVGGAAVAMANKFADTADRIDKTSMKLGVTTDAFQELEYAMGQVGVRQETLEKGLGRLNQRLGDTEKNEKYRAAIENLGIATEDTSGKTRDADEVFMETVQALHEMDDATQQAAKAEEIFGTRTARELMPAIKAGGDAIGDLRDEAHELGHVIGKDSVDAGVLWADTMDKAQKMMGGLFNSVASKALPILQKFLDYGIDNMPVLQEKISGAVSKAGDILSWIGNTGTDVFQNIKDAIDDNQPTIERFQTLASNGGNMLQTAFDNAKPYINWVKDVGIPLAVDAIANIIEKGMDFYNLIKNNWSTIKPLLLGIVIVLGSLKVAMIAMSVVQTVTGFMKAFRVATAAARLSMLGLNGAMLANPITWIVALIVGLIATGVLLYKNWDTVKEKAGDLWSSIKSVFGQIGSFIGGIWDGVQSKTKGVINSIIMAVNAMIRGVNSFQIDVPDWVSKIPGVPNGITSIGYNIPTIPMLAEGGITTGSTLAMIGEGAEQEAILPLSKLQGLLDDPDYGDSTTNHTNYDDQDMTIHYNPTVIIEGNADKKTIDRALRNDRKEIERIIKQYIGKRKRLSLS
ncbi:hypothetical protein [Gracilibacillus sp. YIM 98692]|uniref:hypothetical protein n=1 Tax=Gracilibacillus sp. YIM 98692 TaxID=2663532 RepID=UPI0013D6D57D|nr:hypothetical protein [Gracilibacillus sp. YIM 98692]